MLLILIIIAYYLIGLRVAERIGYKDSYEQYIIMCIYPLILTSEGLINLFFYIKDKIMRSSP